LAHYIVAKLTITHKDVNNGPLRLNPLDPRVIIDVIFPKKKYVYNY
jgi:hypothetical protein